MEALQHKLEAHRRKTQSDAVWAASDAAAFVLNAFRERVEDGSLEMETEPQLGYVLRLGGLTPPEGATFTVGQWVRFTDYVLEVLRESTSMRVTIAPGVGGPCLRFSLSGSEPRLPGLPCADQEKKSAPMQGAGLSSAGTPSGKAETAILAGKAETPTPADATKVSCRPDNIRFPGMADDKALMCEVCSKEAVRQGGACMIIAVACKDGAK